MAVKIFGLESMTIRKRDKQPTSIDLEDVDYAH